MYKCSYVQCEEKASYKKLFASGTLYCDAHAPLQNVEKICFCNEDGCRKMAYYGYIKDKIPIKCRHHHLEDMVKFNNRVCIKKDCVYPATYGYNQRHMSYCSNHYPDGYDFRKIKCGKTLKCFKSHCGKKALYLDPETKMVQHCADHKSVGDILIHQNTLCVFKGCRFTSKTMLCEIHSDKKFNTHRDPMPIDYKIIENSKRHKHMLSQPSSETKQESQTSQTAQTSQSISPSLSSTSSTTSQISQTSRTIPVATVMSILSEHNSDMSQSMPVELPEYESFPLVNNLDLNSLKKKIIWSNEDVVMSITGVYF